MNDLQITSSPIWRFTDKTGNSVRLSLPEVLQTDTPLYHQPHVGYLSDIQHELLASILQVAVDTIWKKGLAKKNYIRLIGTDKSNDICSLINDISDALYKIEGFSLTGNSSFLQIPYDWRRGCEQLPIAKLMWPFIPRVHHRSSAKGLRCPDLIPRKLAPDLTTLFLFTSSTLFRAGANYWTSGNLANIYLAHHHIGSTLRQKLFCAILPGFAPEWRPLQQLQWISKCKNNGGLDYDNKPPSLKYFNGVKKISGTANIRLFQATALSLAPPSKGQCDISGETTVVFDGYHQLTDQLYFEKLSSSTRLKNGIKHPGIMGKMYANTVHPAVIPRPIDDNEQTKLYDSILFQDNGNLPSWVIGYLSKTFPTPIQQSLKSTGKTSSLPVYFEENVFKLRYTSTKQDVEDIHAYRIIGTSPMELYFSQHLSALILATIQETQGLLFKINKFLSTIIKGINQTYKASLRNEISYRLWDKSSQLLEQFSQIAITDNNTSIESYKQEIYFKLATEGFTALSALLDNNKILFSIKLSKQRLIFENLVNIFGYKIMLNQFYYTQNNPTVQAGQLFAKTYKELSNGDKAILRRSDPIYSSRFFWECMKKAKKKDPKLYQPLYEKMILILDSVSPDQNGSNFGYFLNKHKQHINTRNVEILLSANDTDSTMYHIKNITHHLSSKLKRSPRLDFGVLIYDLSSFHFNPDQVKRRWALSFFIDNDFYKKEDHHV